MNWKTESRWSQVKMLHTWQHARPRAEWKKSNAKLWQTCSTLNFHTNIFCKRVVRSRNKLSTEVVSTKDLDAFQGLIKCVTSMSAEFEWLTNHLGIRWMKYAAEIGLITERKHLLTLDWRQSESDLISTMLLDTNGIVAGSEEHKTDNELEKTWRPQIWMDLRRSFDHDKQKTVVLTDQSSSSRFCLM